MELDGPLNRATVSDGVNTHRYERVRGEAKPFSAGESVEEERHLAKGLCGDVGILGGAASWKRSCAEGAKWKMLAGGGG